MTADYLAGRQNVLKAPREELNAKLAALADVFGLDWLTIDGPHALQSLWKRVDALATNELLNFGDAVERLNAESPAWLKGQVYQVKFGDAGQSAGAIFEIVALNLFSRDACEVIPAPEAMPGFDGTLVLKDGSRVLVSIKNHGLSAREQEFQERAAALDKNFQADLHANNLNGIELNVLAAEHLGGSHFERLRGDMADCLAQIEQPGAGGERDWPYVIKLHGMAQQYGDLSVGRLSSGCRVMSPPSANEQANFEEAIRKGCENLHKHTKNQTGDICRMIILRLSNSASIAKCREWAEWYFNEYPEDPIDIILLYQAAITTDVAADTSIITHHVAAIPGPRFSAWQTASGKLRRLPNMGFLVGAVSDQQARLVLTGDGVEGADVSGWYMYQRVDAFVKVQLGEGTEGTLSTPAPGVAIHAVFEQDGAEKLVLASRSDRGHVLALLP